MPTFEYEALDNTGKPVHGTVEAEFGEDAVMEIRRLGYFPTSVQERKHKAARPSDADDAWPSPHGAMQVLPRAVPLRMWPALYFGSGFAQFGWLFGGFGLLFVLAFLPHVDVASWWHFRGELEQAQGKVVDTHDLSISVNDVSYWTYRYEFSDGSSRRHTGESYAPEERFEPGQAVSIEFPMSRPDLARIAGTSRGMPPSAVFVVLFPLIGFTLASFRFFRGFKEHRLLRRGRITEALLTGKEATNTRINEQRVYRLTFLFEDERGQGHEVATRTHKPHKLEDEEVERVLYDTNRPKHAVMLDAIPGSPQFNRYGELQRASWLSLAWLIIPGFVTGAALLMILGMQG